MTAQAMTHRMPWGLIAALWVAEMASAFESAMILAALKVLVAEFRDPAMVGWLVTGFLIVGAAASAVVGRLGDLYGRRRVMLIVLAVGACGSLISAASSSFAMLLAGRVLQGVTATILPLCIGLVRENLPEDRVPAGIGLMISGASVGTAAGLIAGGMIVDLFHWHGIFVASAFFCAAAWAAVRWLVPPSVASQPGQPVDWLSGLLFAPGVTLVLLYLMGGKAWGWSSPAALALLAAGIALCGWWVRLALRSVNPLIDVRALGNRSIAVICGASALVAMGTMQIMVFFSLLMQAPTWTVTGLGLSATMAGFAKLPSNLTSVLGGPLGGWLAGRGGGRFAMVVGGLVATAGWVMTLIDASSLTLVIIQLIVISFGTMMLFAVAPTIIAAAAPPERTSELVGMLGVIRSLFMGIGSQLVATLLAVETVTNGKETYPSPFAFQVTLGAIIALSLGAVAVSLALPGRKKDG